VLKTQILNQLNKYNENKNINKYNNHILNNKSTYPFQSIDINGKLDHINQLLLVDKFGSSNGYKPP
jgi:hypothetical protein